MKRRIEREVTLAICPFYRGFAFVAFESPLSPIDWGIKVIEGPHKVARSLEIAKRLIDRLEPATLVLESTADPQYRRGKRVRRLQTLIAHHAKWRSIELHMFARYQIGDSFKPTGAVTRYEIAQAVASQIEALRHRMPPPRKKWKSEDTRMRLFNAAALALTFYCQTGPIAGLRGNRTT